MGYVVGSVVTTRVDRLTRAIGPVLDSLTRAVAPPGSSTRSAGRFKPVATSVSAWVFRLYIRSCPASSGSFAFVE
jgi:hypothetical protein